MSNRFRIENNHIKLYTTLIGQLQKYNTIIWQGPTALIAANSFALEKFHSNPLLLCVLAIFNTVIIYSFHRMIIHQKAIINATKKAEKKLGKIFPHFIPEFSETKVSAGTFLIWTLSIFDIALFIYAITIVYA
ncbi:MAG TPA: hypothetical protein DHV16_03005 [Nitrospiraceae bacterium]|nr:MAG: hypothetical protein A2Z82_10510 [Nitrospirae bacterium GWA2_46_11]OGW24643.1 MAG: hypothetical protein A2X55_06480 [Nitrospirae bacterium GWB2_47_37]HAK88076.1 hypothetical protein [Nitrospiraceae bacterium]HCL81529.1 hypothetical protein [Nitrospiraceae bacterium]HCZ11231.1 hypothetical protein [Nitrospiraceae bacterium]